jgi:translation elongation factor EF-1beta
VNPANKYGPSPLSPDAKNEKLEDVKTLIKAGADLYSLDDEGRSPVAYGLDSLEILKAMVKDDREERDSGVESSTATVSEATPRVRAVNLALRYVNESGPDYGADVTDFLQKEKAHFQVMSLDGRNLISWAAQGGNARGMQALFKSVEDGTNVLAL